MPITQTTGRAPHDSGDDARPSLSVLMAQIIRNAESVTQILPALEIASYRACRG